MTIKEAYPSINQQFMDDINLKGLYKPIPLSINRLHLYDSNKFFVSEINILKAIATTKKGGYKEVVRLYFGVPKNQYDHVLFGETIVFRVSFVCFLVLETQIYLMILLW